MKKIIVLPFLMAGILIGAGMFYMNGAELSSVNAQATSTASIQIDEPDPNDIVSSPMTVSGQATGTWFFEDSAPVKVYNSNGTLLGQGTISTVSGNWMTTSSVAFTGTINFSNPNTATGTVVFERSNPSGLPQNAASSTVQVRFASTTPGTPNTGGRSFWFLNLDWFRD